MRCGARISREMKRTLASWQKVIDSVLRPPRPHLERCIAEREAYVEARRRAIRDCEIRIEQARSAVFAANDGVVTARMTELEREWRTLSRADQEGKLMDLWARIAPPSWIDRKRWRDSDPEHRLDALIALASDPQGVEAAEQAVLTLRPKARIRWRLRAHDAAHVRELVPAAGESFERDVYDLALARHPDRPLLARDIAYAAFYETIAPNHVRPFVDLWTNGYVIADVEAAFVTLEIPPL